MSDEQTGVEEKVEAPTATVPAEESQEIEADQPESQQQESPESETGENEVGETEPPKDNAAWAAMRTENKRLKETLENVDPVYLERLREATSPIQEQSPQQYQPMSDDADYSEVTQRMNWAQDQIVRANQRAAQLEARLELQQDRQAELAFPELKSDKVFQQLVAEKKLAARVLGQDRTTAEIAQEVKRLLDRKGEQLTAQVQESTKQQVAESQAAMAEARGQTSGGRSAISDESLRDKVRKGDSEAVTDMARGLIADLEF